MRSEEESSGFQLTENDRWALAQLGKNVYYERTRKGLSQMELAERAAITHTYVSEVELGKKSVSFVVVIRLAYGLRVNPISLLAGTIKNGLDFTEGEMWIDGLTLGQETDSRSLYMNLLRHSAENMDDRELKAMCYVASVLERVYGNTD